MKRFQIIPLILGVIFGLTFIANAELIDNGDGTITDTNTGLMWLKNANSAGNAMTWEDANAWAESFNFAGYDDWRLPSGANPDGTICNSRPSGYNCVETEFWGLYGGYLIMTINPGPFENIQYRNYWTSTEWTADPNNAMAQDMEDGGNNDFPKSSLFWAWAVRDEGLPAQQEEILCFPPFRPIPGNNNPPIIDGIIQEDVAWTGATRLTYGDGSASPHVAFQALKAGYYLFLSFEVKNDPSFDNSDVVVINFRKSSSGGSVEDDRKIFIYPICDGIGAAGSDCTLDTPDDKINRPPRLIEVWKNSSNWTGSTLPTNSEVKVRSFTNGSSYAWNLEVKVPMRTAEGGQEWIDLDDDFLFYFNVMRASSIDNSLSEFRWPRSAPEIIGDLDSYPFFPEEWGRGTKSDSVICKGVWIERSDIGTENDPLHQIKFTAPPNTYTNTFYAVVKNDTELGGTPQVAQDVRVQFRLANWGIPGPGDWAYIPATNPGCPDLSYDSNPTCHMNIPAASSQNPGTERFILKWKVPDLLIPLYQEHDHQCILVELDSLADMNIVTKGVYRNMDFVTASEFVRSAEISARGYGPPPNGMAEHQFILHVTTQGSKIESLEKEHMIPSPDPQMAKMTWIAHGYRGLGRFIIIQRHRYSLIDPVGSFGYVVKHLGKVKQWKYKLSGAQKIGNDLYELNIPRDGASTVVSQIEPVEHRWSTGVFSGAAFPFGSFRNEYDPGINLLFSAYYQIMQQVSFGAVVGYNDFKSKVQGIDDRYWINVSANIRYHIPMKKSWSIYLGAGPGLYIQEAGDNKFGFNAGLGLNYIFNNLITFEFGTDYHVIFDEDIQFLHSHAGVIFRF